VVFAGPGLFSYDDVLTYDAVVRFSTLDDLDAAMSGRDAGKIRRLMVSLSSDMGDISSLLEETRAALTAGKEVVFEYQFERKRGRIVHVNRKGSENVIRELKWT
jgi:hypothetical protein